MNRHDPRQSEIRHVVLLCTGLSFMCAAIGWVAEARLRTRFATAGYAEQAPPSELAFQKHAAARERAQTSSPIESQRADLNQGTAPLVKVRAHNHGAFERVAAPTLVPAAPDPEQDAIQELRQALQQRDAAIESLRARVEQLERTVALSSGNLDRVTAGDAGPMPGVGVTPRPQPRTPSGAAADAPVGRPAAVPPPAPSQTATSEPQSATTSQAQGPESTGPREPRETAQQQPTAPGQVEVDEEAAERALEFTLVQQGALLLPFGRAEFTPGFTYTRRTNDFPVVLGQPGSQVVGEQEVRRNEFEFSAGLQVGLPLDSRLGHQFGRLSPLDCWSLV